MNNAYETQQMCGLSVGVKSSTKKGMKKVKALVGNLAGKYLLSYSKGQTFEIEEKQAAEMIEAGDVKEV